MSASASAVGTCCFGNFACFGGIVQRLVLGAVWLLPVLCGCC